MRLCNDGEISSSVVLIITTIKRRGCQAYLIRQVLGTNRCEGESGFLSWAPVVTNRLRRNFVRQLFLATEMFVTGLLKGKQIS